MIRMGRRAGVVLALAAVVPVAAQQRAPRDVAPSSAAATGAITGVVRAAADGAVLRGAEVVLTGGALPANRARHAYTDTAGRYRIDGLAPGQYTVRAAKTGYAVAAYGQPRATGPGAPVDVAAGETAGGIDVALLRQAVIVVRVLDPSGDPVPGFRVVAHRVEYDAGERRLEALPASSFHSTDDRGEIRVSGLAPGEYCVSADPDLPRGPLGPRARYSLTFYPGTTVDEAEPVTVGVGEEVTIAIPLRP